MTLFRVDVYVKWIAITHMSEVATGSECESESELMASDPRGETGGRRWTCCRSSSSYSPALSSSPPRDRGYLVYLCMLMAGAGFLFPWTSYITAVDYFFFLYWEEFHQVSVVIPMTYLLSTCFFTTVNVSTANHFPLHWRIGFGYLIFFLALLVVPLLDVAVHSCALSTRAAYYLTILSVAMVGVGSGVQQSSYYGLAGMLPARYPQAVMAGESVAGLIVSINRIITKSSTSSERFGAIAFFIVSLLFIVLCVGCQLYIRASPFVRYHTTYCAKKDKGREEKEEEEEEERSDTLKMEAMNGTDASDDDDQDTLIDSPAASSTLASKLRAGLCLRLSIMREIWQLIVAVFSSYLITLLVFPGLISEVQYCPVGDWVPVILVTVFNVTDFIAKWLALLPVYWSSTRLMVGALVRAVLVIPILLTVSPSPTHPIIHPGTLGWAVLFVFLLGLSNGYFGSLPMIVFSREVKQPERREMAGIIMTLFLLVGLMIGSVLAYGLTPLTTLREYSDCSSNATALFNSCQANSTAA